MSKYELGVNFNFSKNQTNIHIKQSEFDELMNRLKTISDEKFEFIYREKSLSIDNVEIIIDKPSYPNRPTRIENLEMRLDKLRDDTERIEDEIACIKKGD